MIFMVTPQHKNPCPGVHKIYNFGRPFLGHHCNTYSICLVYAQAQRRRLLNKYINHTLYPKIMSLWGKVLKFTISYLLILQMLHTKFGPVVLQRKMLMDDAQRTPSHSNRVIWFMFMTMKTTMIDNGQIFIRKANICLLRR